MEILVGDIVENIKKTFNDTKVFSVETIYEKTDSGDLKLIISLNKILYDDINVIYTKIIFNTDNEKINLSKNYFTYLYDINCEYVRIDFSDISDFDTKITNIFKENKFGENLKILSDFIKSPSTLINTWYQKNKISDLSVINIEVEKIDIMPCKDLNFSFDIELSNNQTVNLTITKEDSNFSFKFDFLNNIYEQDANNLNSLVQIIANTLKNKINM